MSDIERGQSPKKEIKEVDVGRAIRELERWLPGAGLYCDDYSSEKYPTVPHISREEIEEGGELICTIIYDSEAREVTHEFVNEIKEKVEHKPKND